jgi:hypothetical protein
VPDSPVVWDLDGRLLDALTSLGAQFERVEVGAYLVELPGRTRVWFIAGEQAVAVEAFVLHLIEVPDPGPLHLHALRRNLGRRGVHYAVDPVGDLFLVGSMPHAACEVEGVDRVLGEVLQLLLDDSTTLLALAYGTRLAEDPALEAKVLADGAGRRPAGTPDWSPRRDARR